MVCEFRKDALPFFIVMRFLTGTHQIYNTDRCIKERRRVTRDDYNDRIYFLKTEYLCHQVHNTRTYFNIVTAEKYIDDKQVCSFTWVQTVDEDELIEWLKTPTLLEEKRQQKEKKTPTRKPKYTPEELRERKRQRQKEYYLKHREELNDRRKQYYYDHKDEKKAYREKYYQEHKDGWYEKYIKKNKNN